MIETGKDLRDLLSRIHFVGADWPAQDQPPPHPDGRPWWDSPESAADQDDDESRVPAEPVSEQTQSLLAKHGVFTDVKEDDE